MYADDFLFNGQQASDFGLIICDDSGGEGVVSGGDISISTVRPPATDIFDFYTGAFDDPIQYSFNVIKASCSNPNDIYITPQEESSIANWLIGGSKTHGYGWLQFSQDGYRDICYKVCFTSMKPIQVIGRTIGFELSCTSNCGYAFSYTKIRQFNISGSSSTIVNISSDIDTYIYPYIKISGGRGEYTIMNENDTEQAATVINSNNGIVILDCENDIVESGITDPKNFNWIFPRLKQGENLFSTNSEYALNIELNYREPRRVLV